MKCLSQFGEKWRRLKPKVEGKQNFGSGKAISFGKFVLPCVCLLLNACATQHYEPRPVSAEGIAKDLDDHSLNSPALGSFVQARYRQTELSWPPREWNLDNLTLVALFFNPELDTARAKLATTEAAQISAAQRPNPVLQLPFQRTLNPKVGDSPWILGFALDIPIETVGKRGYRMDEAAYLVAASRLQMANAAWRVRSQLREHLLTLRATSERTKLVQQQVNLDQALVSMLEKRLSVGYASAWEVNQQRLSMIQSRNDLLTVQREVAAARVRVATVLGLRVERLAGSKLNLTEFGQAFLEIPAQEIRLQALLNRADVLEGLAQYQASQAALQLEVAKQYPNLHLGPGYTLDQGARKVGFDFAGLELPIINRNEGPIAEARGRRMEAEARVRQVEAKAFADADSAEAAYLTTYDALTQNQAQLAVQRRQLASAQRALAIGQDDRTLLVLVEKAELVAQLAVLDSIFQMQQAIGRVEDAMQRPISGAFVQYGPNELTK